ncbi:MAG: hypothetical protein DRQ54_10100 [Gammaproteobacteria bacterium]|nr:MAG: hypothetical protein DRQ54_10100 [Gammaproteobacteria bacterium]
MATIEELKVPPHLIPKGTAEERTLKAKESEAHCHQRSAQYDGEFLTPSREIEDIPTTNGSL